MRLLLASASPRRAKLLRAAGFEFDVQPADVDEAVLPGELPAPHVRRLAELKAAAIAGSARGRIVLAADTVVVLDDHILGKPANEGHARRMLRRLSGRRHQVMTGVTTWRGMGDWGLGIGNRGKGKGGEGQVVLTRVETTTVEFAPLSDEEIDWYVASGEPADKAGAYAVQGLASRFVTRIDGSYSNVVGLPVEAVYAILKELGWKP